MENTNEKKKTRQRNRSRVSDEWRKKISDKTDDKRGKKMNKFTQN